MSVEASGWSPTSLAALATARGWTQEAIDELALRYDEKTHRVDIPIRDNAYDLLGWLAYDAEHRNSGPKMVAPAGVPRQLFPPPESLPNEVTELLITEGEPDTIAAVSYGFSAVGVPGTNGWEPGYADRFSGRPWVAYIVFDCDPVGRKAAWNIAASLAFADVEAYVVDLDPGRNDGYDLTDYLHERGADALRVLLREAPDRQQRRDEQLWGEPQPEEAAPIVFETLRDFLSRELPQAEALVGVPRDGTNLLPRYGWVMPWGREGSSKTSLLVDLLFHAAAGRPWLSFPVSRPLRVVFVINEGVPGGLQDKLRQKVERWDGEIDAVLDNVAIYASPWGEFSFRDERMAAHARDYALDFGADYVAFDPLHTLGAGGAGAPAETEAFKHTLRSFGLWQDLGVITAHHSNKLGMVSGDWARHPDTVLHVEKDGKRPRTKLTIEKARPADPEQLGVPLFLGWVVESFGYALERVETGRDEEAVIALVVEAVERADRPLTLTDLHAILKPPGEDGPGEKAVDSAARAALEAGRISNRPRSGRGYGFVPAGLAEVVPHDFRSSSVAGVAEVPPEDVQTRMVELDDFRNGELRASSPTPERDSRTQPSPPLGGEGSAEVGVGDDDGGWLDYLDHVIDEDEP